MIKIYCSQCGKDVPFYLPQMSADGNRLSNGCNVGCPQCHGLLVTLTGFNEDRVRSEGEWLDVFRHGILRGDPARKKNEARLLKQLMWEAGGG